MHLKTQKRKSKPVKLYLIVLSILYVIFSIKNYIYAEELPSLSNIVKKLNLVPYPGGNSGYSAKTYRSKIKLNPKQLPNKYKAKQYRLFSSIYYLLPETGLLKFHATTATKQFHHYLGEPILIIIIQPNGKLQKVILGKNILNGEIPQLTINSGSYIAAINYYKYKQLKNYKKTDEAKFTLIGCTTAPSWEIEDCIRADYIDLIKRFPQHKDIIKQFT